MARRDRESIHDSGTADDTHDLLFGADHDDHDELGEHGEHDDPSAESDGRAPRPSPGRRGSRLEARQASRTRRKRRVVGVLAVVLVAVLAASVYFIGLPVYRYLYPADYDGNGTGSVVVTVHANDGSAQIGQTLTKADVVGSERAFTEVAADDDRAQSIQPGAYKLRKQMSAQSALTLLLDPSSKVDSDTVIPEGANIFAVEQRLTAPRCSTGGSAATSSGGCGLGASKADVVKALQNVKSLGIPTDYLPGGKTPGTAEGFLYPATYTFDDETTLAQALQQMVGKFTDVARSNRFSSAAKTLGITPYEALTLASMVQSEARFTSDMPKVARVILNRLASDTPLKIDAASVYAAELAGVDPKKTDFATIAGPYNTYRNTGLPPSPVSNPGSDSLKAAVSPAKGNWTYYVNGDAQGHLFFTNSETAFVKAQQKCFDNGWGCAAP